MPNDIYTTLPIATRSEEHIVPCFLGGGLASRNLIDKTTNDRFGHGIDAALEQALRSVRVILGARNCDGDPPRALARVRGEDGKHYHVESGGKVKPQPRGRIIPVSEREFRLEASVSDAGELRQMLRKRLVGKEAQLDALVEKAMSESTTLSQSGKLQPSLSTRKHTSAMSFSAAFCRHTSKASGERRATLAHLALKRGNASSVRWSGISSRSSRRNLRATWQRQCKLSFAST